MEQFLSANQRSSDACLSPRSSGDPSLPSPSILPAEFLPGEVPDVLKPSAFDHHLVELTRQFRPEGYLEYHLVRDLARQQTALEKWDQGVAAMQRQRARYVPELVPFADDRSDLEDLALAAAVSAAEIRLADRHAQAHARAFHRALHALLAVQAARRRESAPQKHQLPPNPFTNEAACEIYLRKRFEEGHYHCPRCGAHRGHYLASRRGWECAGCGRQTGLRTGTVAADSPLPLTVWFAAIWLLLGQPTMQAAEMNAKLGIRRHGTVARMARRIRAAMGREDGSDLLAGLDGFFASSARGLPESGARVDQNVRSSRDGSRQDAREIATSDSTAS